MAFADRLKRLTRLRFAVLYPLVVYAAFFRVTNDATILVGYAVMLAGIAMRLWSNGYAIKMDKLTVSGPYAHVRNPLYLGTMLIIVGFIVLLQMYWLGLGVMVIMGFTYRRTVCQEEKMLAEKFGQAYLDYKQHVPLLFPSLNAYTKGETWGFSWPRLWQSREHKIFIWMTIVVIAFHVKEKMLLEKEGLTPRVKLLIAAAVVLALLDAVLELFRHRNLAKKL